MPTEYGILQVHVLVKVEHIHPLLISFTLQNIPVLTKNYRAIGTGSISGYVKKFPPHHRAADQTFPDASSSTTE